MIGNQDIGWITAPDNNNDDLYDNNAFCSWILRVPTGEKIEYEIVYVRLEYSKNCVRDFLQVGYYYNQSFDEMTLKNIIATGA